MDQLLTLHSSELRKYELEDFLELMTKLGISIDGVETKTEAATRLMMNAYEVDED